MREEGDFPTEPGEQTHTISGLGKRPAILTFHRDLAKFFLSCSDTVPWIFLLLAAFPEILQEINRTALSWEPSGELKGRHESLSC